MLALPREREKIWAEAAATATKLENIIVDKKEDKCPYYQIYGKMPDYSKYLRTFGEVSIVPLKTGNQMKAKLDDRGTACIFVGYARKHAENVYRMLNVKTNAVIVTRDVNWLNKIWYEQEKTPRVKIEYVETKKEVEKPEDEFENTESDSETEESKNSEGTNESASNALSEKYWKNLGRKMPREIKRLQTSTTQV